MSSRQRAALAPVVLTVLGGVFLLSPRCASACQCTMPVEKPTLAESSAVFSGEVVEIDQPSHFKSSADLETDTFRVYEVWKGPEQKTLVVHTALMGMRCGYPFKEGQEYLVYAYTGKQGLEVGLCGNVVPLSAAGSELRVLGAGEKPTVGGVLTDTSGSVSASAMVGVAGLVMAGSLLVVARLVRTGQTQR